MEFDLDLDAQGLLCPLPVLKARKRLLGLVAGQVLRLQTDDPAAVIDVPHYCAESGNVLIDQQRKDKTIWFFIRKV